MSFFSNRGVAWYSARRIPSLVEYENEHLEHNEGNCSGFAGTLVSRKKKWENHLRRNGENDGVNSNTPWWVVSFRLGRSTVDTDWKYRLRVRIRLDKSGRSGRNQTSDTYIRNLARDLFLQILAFLFRKRWIRCGKRRQSYANNVAPIHTNGFLILRTPYRGEGNGLAAKITKYWYDAILENWIRLAAFERNILQHMFLAHIIQKKKIIIRNRARGLERGWEKRKSFPISEYRTRSTVL